MARLLDLVDRSVATLASLLFFITGVILIREVIGRYVFSAPTIWAEEISRLILIWGTFIGAIAVSMRNQHIRVNVIDEFIGPGLRRVRDALVGLCVAAFAIASGYYAFVLLQHSIHNPTTSGTMLDLPTWIFQGAPVLGLFGVGAASLVHAAASVTGKHPSRRRGEVIEV